MVKLVIKGKLVEMDEDELERKFSPNTLGSLDQFKVMKALAEGPKQVPTIMEDLNLTDSKDSDRNYGRVRYYLIKLYENELAGKHKVNAKTALWYLTEKGLEALEKGAK